MVLELDVYKLTLPEAIEFVRGKCAQYGTVKSVSGAWLSVIDRRT